MEEPVVRKAPLVWWACGLILGLTQLLAVSARDPLGVSTQFVVGTSLAVHQVAPEYAKGHKLISKDKYTKLGYGWWLDVGLVAGAFLAAVAAGRWRLRVRTVWWSANGRSAIGRLGLGFVGGFLILLGARLAHGCTSGQFASGWAQLSLSVVPFTVGMFVFGMLAAKLVYPKAPAIEKEC